MATGKKQGQADKTRKTSTTSRINGKPNGNILNFFKKSANEAIFFEERRVGMVDEEAELQAVIEASKLDAECQLEEARYNESTKSMKRLKTIPTAQDHSPSNQNSETIGHSRTRSQKKSGPFLEDSDSDDDDDQLLGVLQVTSHRPGVGKDDTLINMSMVRREPAPELPDSLDADKSQQLERQPLLQREVLSGDGGVDFLDFVGMDDFDEELYEEGDEYMEKHYMEEQARLEAMEAAAECDLQSSEVAEAGKRHARSDAPVCPICGSDLYQLGDQEAAIHVNSCLDGIPSSPNRREAQHSPTAILRPESFSKTARGTSAAQFRKPQRTPRPGQASPFSIEKVNSTSEPSAFSRLMAGHTEEAAWAEAAACEQASRGKPSYQRTCPFYKILPGLFICVDAFRYGAVQGCQAYFLSHFHSDHYVGLTSHWTHGPIYCSKVTANLVKQQLGVDPKYVMALGWEKKTEVPNTKGVMVTMISANHCPGSSLFLFEKEIGMGSGGFPKSHRILHCGDFRACRAHVEHPLLMPDVQDSVTGMAREQRIDVCYLDTTYLNPRYAFPSQEMVITACAELCVSLSNTIPDEADGWEQMKRQRAGESMTRFVQRQNASSHGEGRSMGNGSEMMLKSNPHPDASQQIISMPGSKLDRGRLLVVVGTYSIGKERICLGIARALNSKIYAPPAKQRIVAALEDPELDKRMTSDPRAAQVHMTPLFEIRAETLDDYLKDYFPHFTRAVGFRPSGWNYRPPNSRFTDSPGVATILYSDNWKSTFSMKDLIPQRGSTSRASCFGVPYSEHSSFRELTMFCTALRIQKIIPTVNVGSAKSRERMKNWSERWMMYRKKEGLFKLEGDETW